MRHHKNPDFVLEKTLVNDCNYLIQGVDVFLHFEKWAKHFTFDFVKTTTMKPIEIKGNRITALGMTFVIHAN